MKDLWFFHVVFQTKALGSTVPYQPQKSFYGSDLYNSRTGYGVPGLRSYLSQQPVCSIRQMLFCVEFQLNR